MAWQDNLTPARYTSPSGVEIGFDFEVLNVTRTQRGAVFNFGDAAGSYVQQGGVTSRRFPLRCYVSGENYDELAAAFEAALSEPGEGTLHHPLQGDIVAVPLGAISRRDDLARAAEQAVIDVELYETTGLVYPSQQAAPAQDVQAAIAEADSAAAGQLAASEGIDTATEKADFIARYNAALADVANQLAPLYEAVDDIQREFNRIQDSINRTIDTLVNDPLTLAFQTQRLIATPARVFASAKARLEGYRNLFTSILGIDQGEAANAGALAANDMVAAATLTAEADSLVNAATSGRFNTRTEAVTAAVELIEQLEAYGQWRDENQFRLGTDDTGAAWGTIQAAIATAAGAIVSESFALRQERRVVTEKPRTVIDLCAQLYGSVDNETLDQFIVTNALNGDEIREVPRGREVVYYG